MSTRRLKDRTVISGMRRIAGRPSDIIQVIDGSGKNHVKTYVWIGPERTGPPNCILNKREMRQLRDALNVALGE